MARPGSHAIPPGESEPDAGKTKRTRNPQKSWGIRDHDATREPSAPVDLAADLPPASETFEGLAGRPARLGRARTHDAEESKRT
jgi:hypothetical protein